MIIIRIKIALVSINILVIKDNKNKIYWINKFLKNRIINKPIIHRIIKILINKIMSINIFNKVTIIINSK